MKDVSFGPFRLRRQERLLEGPDGPVDLSARGFDLLCVLLDWAGEIVSKDALFDAVWPGVMVEENTLQVHISALRKALGAAMVATVHGRGYRYAGPQPVVDAAPRPPRNPPRTQARCWPCCPSPILAATPASNTSATALPKTSPTVWPGFAS